MPGLLPRHRVIALDIPPFGRSGQPEADKLLRGILSMGPLAVRLSMEAVDQGLEMTLEEGLLLEANHFGLLAATQDMKEGLTAFLEKRPAKFAGR